MALTPRVAFSHPRRISRERPSPLFGPYEIRRIAPGALVVAGDTANTLAGWNEALQQLQSLEMPKLIVPGNHDVWIESKSALRRAEDSGWKYNEALRAATVQYGWHYLPHDPIILHDIGFVGSLGWYDYSLRDPRVDASVGFGAYDEGTFIDSSRCVWVWNDTRYAVAARTELRGLTASAVAAN